MFFYCEKCGYIIKKNKQENCPVCDNELRVVPDSYLTPSKNLFLSQETRARFIDEVIKNNPLYSEEIAESRGCILKEKCSEHQKEIEEKVKQYNESAPTCRCPVCGSSNLSAISNVGKIAKISLIGVWGAGDLGKQRRCNSCGHKF